MPQSEVHLLNVPDAHGLNLFGSLPADLWNRLDQTKEIRTYSEDAVVYQQGEWVGGLFQLFEGEWKVVHSDPRGYHQILEFLKPGAVTAIIPVFEGRPSCCAVQSLRKSRGFYLPGDAFKQWALADEAGMDVVLRYFSARVRHLMDVAHGLSLQTVPERLARVLVLEHQRRAPSTLLEFQEDQGELGLHIGCTRAAVSRGLKLLSDMGLIRSTFPVVRVLDLPTLQRIARFTGDPQAHPGRAPAYGGSLSPQPQGHSLV